MRKLILLFGMIFLFSTFIFAQAKPNFSGNWSFNKEKSSLDSTIPIQSRIINVIQTEKELTIENTTTWEKSVNGRPTMVNGGNGTTVYPLDGKEITVEREGFRGKTPVKIKGELLSDGKLILNSSSMGLFNNVEGITTNKQIWELSDNGKTLKIVQTNTTPRGEIKSEMVFTKN